MTCFSLCLLERDATKRLTGRVEIDDAYLCGERSGSKRGRGAPGKTPFVAAVETTADGSAEASAGSPASVQPRSPGSHVTRSPGISGVL
jgi:hypothetical protein